MIDCVKETLCTKCEHRNVCKYKEDYLKVVESVYNAIVCFEADNGKHGMKKVTNYDFIGEIKIPCKYYCSTTDIASICNTLYR